MLNTTHQSTCFQEQFSCAESAFPGKDNAFHYKNYLQAVLGPGAEEAGAVRASVPKTSLLSDLTALPGNSKEESRELPMDGKRRGRSVAGTLLGDEARPPPCVEKPPFLRAEVEVVSMLQMPRWARSPAVCSTQDHWAFDIPIPSASANAPSPKHRSWKKIPKPLFAGAPSLPLVFHSEHLRKDSSLLQVFDTWVSLLPWANSGVSEH